MDCLFNWSIGCLIEWLIYWCIEWMLPPPNHRAPLPLKSLSHNVLLCRWFICWSWTWQDIGRIALNIDQVTMDATHTSMSIAHTSMEIVQFMIGYQWINPSIQSVILCKFQIQTRTELNNVRKTTTHGPRPAGQLSLKLDKSGWGLRASVGPFSTILPNTVISISCVHVFFQKISRVNPPFSPPAPSYLSKLPRTTLMVFDDSSGPSLAFR